MNSKLKRVALPLGAAVILGSSGFAFMASNSVPVTRAGDGSAAISGYNVSNVSFDTNDNARIGAVRFTLDGPARPDSVAARIGSGRYDRGAGNGNTPNDPQGCQLTGSTANSTSWLCIQNAGFVTATLADANELRVFAAQ